MNPIRMIIIILYFIVLLALITLLTNYFLNFLPFSWLPYQVRQNSQTGKQDSLTPQKVKNDITAFIKSSLDPSLIPADYEIQQAKLKQSAINQNPNQFTVSLNNGVVIGISAAYDKQLLIENRSISLTLPQSSTPSAASATTLTAQYLTIKPQGTWKCNPVSLGGEEAVQATICENFWTDPQQIKHGVGAMSPIPPTFENTSIFACELYPQSLLYSWKSCSIYFKDQGITGK